MPDTRTKAEYKMILKIGVVFLMLIAFLLLVSVVLAQGNYDLARRVIAGGGGQMQNAGYVLMNTSGQPLAGTIQSSSYSLCTGFWCGNVGYGVMLDPDAATKSGAPGETVPYTLRMTNMGDLTDTFDLTYTGIGAYLSVTQTMLAAGAGSDVIANVTIPSSATNGASYTTIVTATSQSDPTQSDTSVLTTTAVSSCTSMSAADFGFTPATPLVGKVITFSATLTPTSATLPITYTWDFDEGAGSVGQIVTHTFPSTITAKTYIVTLVVDNVCEDPAVTAQKPVIVRPYTIHLPLIAKD